jgi:transposase InsO family protein
MDRVALCRQPVQGFTPLSRRIQLDTYFRRIVGWSIANNLKTELVLDALNTWRSTTAGHHQD